MNIIKLGGSIVNPDGKYDDSAIQEFIDLVKDTSDKFIFIVGGGKLCRFVQDASAPSLNDALGDENSVNRARDWVGIATTNINAEYVLNKFVETFNDEVYPQLLLDPTQKLNTDKRIFFTGGWKPGSSTDKDMMLLAETFNADNVFKISDFKIVKDIKPTEFAKVPKEEKEKVLSEANDIHEMTWKDLHALVGDEWIPGLSTPFDSKAVQIGLTMKSTLTLYIGRKEEVPKMLAGEKFVGTIVKG
ncbi:hypothetical protein HOL21_00390 [Candidatus Woesearchaeota archaeon]|jgi:uridylate kinase|nr:hypothetical protein [Candidatus Woesearchaeota archaeon]MBT5396655.1 hypothetical protein [Candidatus Woesearchaeota archaeon]MBT5924223.1 hypothetical protein [Candidatus Woesearchaeota archaeon]MBT6367558.1 hypothetical protein [Candidatus Woesearchaeota archaeon]MBT7763057.1 hypothetical protein [Candidatus Woesearchaeota archaeon]